MKKRLLACLLTLCLTIGMISAIGFSASATEATAVACVTSGDATYEALTFADAITTALASKNSTVKLLADTQTDGMEIGGDYSIDLNGKVLTVTGPLNISAGTVTVLDSSDTAGSIAADKTSAIVLKGGSLMVSAGKIHSKSTFAVQNCGKGEIFLSGKPSLTSDACAALYVGYANTLNGNNNDASYTGEPISVCYGCKLEQDTVLAKNATGAQFTVQNYDTDHFMIEEKDGNLVVYKITPYAWLIIGGLAILTVVLLIFMIVHTVQYKRRMKFYSLSLPVLVFTLPAFTQMQSLALIIVGAAFAIVLIATIITTKSQNKKLTAAKKAKALRDAQARIAAEEAKEAAEAQAAAEEAIIEETTVEEAAVEEAIVEEAVVEEAVVEEAPAEEAIIEEAAVEEAVVEEAPAEEAPVEEAVVEEAVVEEAPAEEAPVEEAVVEEAVVEEAVVEEAVVEEVAVEEAIVEEAVVEEAPAEEAPVEETIVEEAPVVAEPPKAKPDRVVIAETDANGNVIYSAYKKSFTARVIQSPVEVQERYEALKNALLSYKKVNSRVSWSYDSIKSGRKQLAKFAIRGKSLCLFLALDMSGLEDTKYNVTDVSDSKKYATVPCRLRLSSKRSIKWGLELIEKLAEQEGLVPNPKFTPKKWCMENETTESLIEKGLIKKIV